MGSLFARCSGHGTFAVALFLIFAITAQAADESVRIHRFETSLRPGLSVAGEPQQRWTLAERMAHSI